jgi:uncharacterized protein (DUF2252 family)
MTAVTEKVATNRSNRTSTRRAAQHLSRAERVALGKQARKLTPLPNHAEFAPGRSRDPVKLLLSQAQTRIPELVPVRHGRMLVSPFTYYRGAALPMAADLAGTPASGLRVQLCGDAHLANFGAFASPARQLVFDINDFDETLPGPFEWDVKRLAASVMVAGQGNGFSASINRKAVLAAVEGYRTAMRDFAAQTLLQVWYAHLDVDQLLADVKSQIKPKRMRMFQSALATARTHDSVQAEKKLTTVVDGQTRIISTPPTIVPIEELFSDLRSDEIYELLRGVFSKYSRSLQTDRRYLIEQFRMVQVARKVVGVGSVGQRAWIVLMDALDGDEPLFLQAKEAEVSVLAEYCGHSQYRNHGERVVAGQHLMQAQSDIFLGWTQVVGADGLDHHYYIRQLRDWKFSAPIEAMRPEGLQAYARMCGWTLARAHARAGDRIALAAYLGSSDKFDQAVADFAVTYAEQNERDHAALQHAVETGRAEAVSGV